MSIDNIDFNDVKSVLAAIGEATLDDRDKILKHVREFCQDNDELMISILLKHYLSLEDANSRLQDNRELAQQLVKWDYDGKQLPYVSERLKNDESFIVEAVKTNPLAIEYASESIKSNQQLMDTLVVEHKIYSALKYASMEVKDNVQIVKEAVKDDAFFLEFASDRLRDDEDVALLAIDSDANCTEAMQFVSDRLKNNREFVLKVVSMIGFVEYVPEEYRNDEEIVMAAVRKDGQSICFAGEQFRDNKEIVREALKNTCATDLWDDISERLKRDEEFVAELIESDPKMLTWCDVELTDSLLKHLVVSQQLKIQELDAQLKELKSKETQAKELLGAYEQQVPSQQHEEN